MRGGEPRMQHMPHPHMPHPDMPHPHMPHTNPKAFSVDLNSPKSPHNERIFHTLKTQFSHTGRANNNTIHNFLKTKQAQQVDLKSKSDSEVLELFKKHADIGNGNNAISPTHINPLKVKEAEARVRQSSEQILNLLQSAKDKKLLTEPAMQQFDILSPEKKLAYLLHLHGKGEHVFGFEDNFVNSTKVKNTLEKIAGNEKTMVSKLQQEILATMDTRGQKARKTSSPVKINPVLSSQKSFSSKDLKEFERKKKILSTELEQLPKEQIDLAKGQDILTKLVEIHRPFTTTQISPRDRLLIVPPDILRKYFTDESLQKTAEEIIDHTLIATKNNAKKRMEMQNDVDRLRTYFNLPELPEGTSYADRRALETMTNANVANLSGRVFASTMSKKRNINTQINKVTKMKKLKNILGNTIKSENMSVLQNPYILKYFDGEINNNKLKDLFTRKAPQKPPKPPKPRTSSKQKPEPPQRSNSLFGPLSTMSSFTPGNSPSFQKE